MRRGNWTKILPGVAVVACSVSCVSMEDLAPPVSPPMAAAYGAGTSQAMLAEGRHLYVTQCAKCHAPEPVRRYSVREWEDLLPEMNEESNLDAAEGEAVRQYVLAVLRMPADVEAEAAGE